MVPSYTLMEAATAHVEELRQEAAVARHARRLNRQAGEAGSPLRWLEELVMSRRRGAVRPHDRVEEAPGAAVIPLRPEGSGDACAG